MPSASPTRNASWDDRPEAYDAVRACWLNDRRTAFVAERLTELAPGAHVVEVGSGTGWLLRRLADQRPDLRFTGVEPLESYVSYAADRTADGSAARFVTGTAERLTEVVDTPADLLLVNDVLHHVDDQAAAARAAAAIARPGARWLVIEPNATNPYVFVTHKLKEGEEIFRARRFVRMAEEAGWRLEARRPLFLIPPQVGSPPRWAVRAEQVLEGVRPLAGGVALRFRLG